MGKSNIAIKQFFRDKGRFADLFNGYVFQGQQIVSPKIWKTGASLTILAIENQDKVHYAMPVRTMLYDSLSYADQIRLLWKNQ